MAEVGERIWVANPSEQNILVLDRRGAATGTVGHAGQGPGEFQTVAGVAVDPAGLVAVYDVAAMSIQLFDSEGTFRERIQVAPRVWNPKGFVTTDPGSSSAVVCRAASTRYTGSMAPASLSKAGTRSPSRPIPT